MPNTTLPTMLRAEALGEIMAYQTQLFKNATGEFPSGDALDIVAKAADSWIEKLIPLLQPPAYYCVPAFEEVAIEDFQRKLFNTFLEKWYGTYVLRAQLFGLSEKTAQAVVDHLHGRTA